MIATVLRTTSLLAFIAMAASACASPSESITGSGVVKSEERAVAGFSGIAISFSGRVDVVQSGRESLTLSADDNVLPLIETVVENNILHVRMVKRPLNLHTRTPMRVTLHVKTLDSVAINGSGDLHAPVLKSGKFSIAIHGSGDVRLGAITADAISVKVRGSGDVFAAGKADSIDISIAGSGDVKAGRLETRRAEVAIAGSGDAQVWAREALSVAVAGSGDVEYFGDPKLSSRIVGSGALKRRGASPS